MLAYTFGIPLSIFAFLLVGALVGTAAPDPGAGIMPGLIAGGIVFALCMKAQGQANSELENPAPFVVDCSPERAFSTIYGCLAEASYGPTYWSVQPMQTTMKIIGTLKFEEPIAGGAGGMSSARRQLRLVASVCTNALGKTVVTLKYNVYSPAGRWTCDEGIAKTTSWIKRDLMLA